MIATDEIKGLIRAHGMTQADVAKRMGIHEATPVSYTHLTLPTTPYV